MLLLRVLKPNKYGHSLMECICPLLMFKLLGHRGLWIKGLGIRV
jgi:hypothetical protein